MPFWISLLMRVLFVVNAVISADQSFSASSISPVSSHSSVPTFFSPCQNGSGNPLIICSEDPSNTNDLIFSLRELSMIYLY